MSNSKQPNFLVRRPLLAFCILSYAFFWLLLILFGVVVVGVLGLDPNKLPGWVQPLITILGSWTPSLAAAIVTAALLGREGVARLFGMWRYFRLPARWYLAAILPLGLAFLAAGFYLALGGAPSGGAQLTLGLLAWLVVYNLLTGATGEEPGWRGFALPRLLQRHTPLKAGLLLGLVWSFWHLPLWLASGLAPADLLLEVLFFNLGIISLTLLMVWVFLRTPFSLVLMTLMHYTFNLGIMLVGPDGLGLGPALPLMGWLSGLLALAAFIVWIFGGLRPLKARTKE